MIILALTILLPFINIFALAFNEGNDASRGGIYFWPRIFTVENFTYIFHNDQLIRAYMITISKTLIGASLSVFLTSMAAFGLKSKTMPGRKVMMGMIFFTTLFSGGIIPYYLLLKNLHLTKSFLIYILPSLYSVYNIIIMRTYFNSISYSLEESAKIDGATDLQVFFKVILPMSKPVISVVILFNGVAQWNDWFTGAYFVRDDNLLPVATLLQKMLLDAQAISKLMQTSGQAAATLGMHKINITTQSLQMAMVIVCTLPIVCVYPFVQKYFVKGIMIGSIKE
jgi:putative aldouronate transport system permease protein